MCRNAPFVFLSTAGIIAEVGAVEILEMWALHHHAGAAGIVNQSTSVGLSLVVVAFLSVCNLCQWMYRIRCLFSTSCRRECKKLLRGLLTSMRLSLFARISLYPCRSGSFARFVLALSRFEVGRTTMTGTGECCRQYFETLPGSRPWKPPKLLPLVPTTRIAGSYRLI
jgi:hypothetical protein